MNFMNIGSMEMMVIVAIAILVVGPKRLVEVGRTIGRLTARMRAISGEFTSIMRAELSELETVKREVTDAIGEVTGSASELGAAADVTGTVSSAKQEADRSMQSIIDEGLGLSEIAAELKATATEARQLVQTTEQNELQKAAVAEAHPQASQQQENEPRQTTVKTVVEDQPQVDVDTQVPGAAEQGTPEKPSSEPGQPEEPTSDGTGPPSVVEAPVEVSEPESEAPTEKSMDGEPADDGPPATPDATDTQADADVPPGSGSGVEESSEITTVTQPEPAASDEDAMVGGDDV